MWRKYIHTQKKESYVGILKKQKALTKSNQTVLCYAMLSKVELSCAELINANQWCLPWAWIILRFFFFIVFVRLLFSSFSFALLVHDINLYKNKLFFAVQERSKWKKKYSKRIYAISSALYIHCIAVLLCFVLSTAKK